MTLLWKGNQFESLAPERFYEHLLSTRHWLLLSQAHYGFPQVLLCDASLCYWQLSCPDLFLAFPGPTDMAFFHLITASLGCHTLWHRLPACLDLCSGMAFGSLGSPDDFTRSLELVQPDGTWFGVAQAPWWWCLLSVLYSLPFLRSHINSSAFAADLSVCCSCFSCTDCHSPRTS